MDYEQEINALKSTVQLQAELIFKVTEQLKAEVVTRIESFLEAAPIGTITAFGGENIPVGWLLCNGESFSAEQFPKLWAAIGVGWGSDPHAERFNVPDLGGMFLRGVDHGGTRDLDFDQRIAIMPGGNSKGQVGSKQDDSFRSHSHSITDRGHSHKYNWLTFTQGPDIAAGNFCARFDDNRYYTTSVVTGITINAEGGAETRPMNAYVNYMIKADSQLTELFFH